MLIHPKPVTLPCISNAVALTPADAAWLNARETRRGIRLRDVFRKHLRGTTDGVVWAAANVEYLRELDLAAQRGRASLWS